MRSSVWHLVAAAVLGSVFVSSTFAQQPTGPATFENVPAPDEAPKPPAAPEAKAAGEDAVRPAGTLVRPKDGVQHPDIDKAWAKYNAAVAKASEGIRAGIRKQFDLAVAKGDLNAAEKWQTALEKYEKSGKVPPEDETNKFVSSAVAECKRAKDELTKAYDIVVRALTMGKNLVGAKQARDEVAALKAMALPELDPKPEKGEKAEKAKEALARQNALAAFVGRWRNADNGNHEEIRADGVFLINNDPANQWSGRWFLDMKDPKGPCVVRESNNKTTARWYLDPINLNTITAGEGVRLHKIP